LDMRHLLGASLRYAESTGGAFDVTVQPLWRAYAAHFQAHPDDESGPEPAALAAARALVDYRAVRLTPARISFSRPDMAITMNGIAQGYIADRVADLLRAEGLRDVLLDLGEIRALGGRPDGLAWQIAIRRPPPGTGALCTVPLRACAMATSAGYGTQFDRIGRFHHLLSPATGAPAAYYRSVTIIGAHATQADALSTAVAVMPAADGERLIRENRVAAVLVRPDGEVVSLGRAAGESPPSMGL
jgi:thiamine biosynthesis lipoprotein